MSERDQFEAWWEEWFGEAPMSGWDTLRTDSGYSAEEIDIQWEAWMGRASREALKAEQGDDGWIACADMMPDESEAVTVCDHGVDVYPAVFIGGEFYEYGDGLIENALRMSNPTHWQPLPSPPAANHPIDTTPNQYDALGKGER